MKKAFIAIFLVLQICFLSSCEYIQEDDAKAVVDEYFALLEAEDYELLVQKSYFCDVYPNDDIVDLIKEFEKLEGETGLDFQAGIDIIKYKKFRSRHSHSYYGVPICYLTMDVSVGGTDAVMEVDIINEEDVLYVCDIYITLNGEFYGIS